MWPFRIACFSSLCAVVWAVSLLTPFHTWQNSVGFLPVVAVLGIAHTVVIMRFTDNAGVRFQRVWVGCTCGVLDAALVFLFMLLVTSMVTLGAKGSFQKVAAAAALCAPFVLPPLLSPRVVALFVKRNSEESPVSRQKV